MKIDVMKTVVPTEWRVGGLIFLFLLVALVTLFGVRLFSFTILFASLCLVRRAVAKLRQHWHDIRWVALVFLFKFVFALLCRAPRAGEYEDSFDER